MSVYKKLQQARMALQNTKLNKSGKNKFAGYEYFELGDFLPQIQAICDNIGLCGTVSFTADMAYLTIYDVDGGDNSFITFTSPMSSAALKGCHDVQNLGAVQTYLRRYLWTNAFEIVEHDALDATTGSEAPVKKPEPVQPPKESVQAPAKNIVGDIGEYSINAAPAPTDGNNEAWLNSVQAAAFVLLELTKSEEDVMSIFKKNKVLFDTVKELDEPFFKKMMSKFTQRKTLFKKD